MHELDKTGLEPCPFCHQKARLVTKQGVAGTACRSNWYREQVVCKGCSASSKLAKRPGAAASAWNRRASTTSAGVTEEQVEAACAAYHAAYTDGTSRAGQQGMRAALEASRVAPVSQKEAEPVCKYCKGSGAEADYVGLEMRCVAVSCSACGGSGHLPAPAPAGEPAINLASYRTARLRFFRDLVEDERVKVYKAFGVLPSDFDERLNHGIETKLFDRLVIRSALHHTPTPVSAPVGVVTGYRLEFQSRADETGYRMKGRQGFATFERAVEFMRKGLAVGQLFTRLTREERFDISEDALAALRSPAVEGK